MLRGRFKGGKVTAKIKKRLILMFLRNEEKGKCKK